MNLLDYSVYRGWELPSDENCGDEGYLVEYLDGGEPNHPDHKGYISWSPKGQFDNGYKLLIQPIAITEKQMKTLHNSTVSGAKKNVSDLVVFGDGDTFKLICKASSKDEGWLKSTKAMEIENVGCIVQVTTQQGDNVAEAITFVPGVKIESIGSNVENGRKLVWCHG